MTRVFNPWVARLLALMVILFLVTGCMNRRTRLMDERSALLRERDQIREPWHPREKSEHARGNPDEPLDPAERTEKINQRVAELDAELLQLK